MYVDCERYKDKGVQTHKNQGQGFLLERQVRNMWCSLCQEVWNWREEEARRGEIMKVEYIKCGKRDVIVRKVLEQERRRILCPEYRIERKREQQNWKEVVYYIEGKVQQGGAWIEALKGTVRKRDEQREVRRIFKMLREIWLNIGVEKVDRYT